jgi:hypothetical protein
MRISSVLCLLSTGCSAGQIEWASGDDLIRTAVYATEEDATSTHVALFLSNGDFGCKLEAGDEAAEREDALAGRCYAAVREDARHVLLHLWYPRGGEPEGIYPGSTTTLPGGPFSEDALTRWSRALYIGVEEVDNNSGDDLVQDEFQVTRAVAWGVSPDVAAYLGIEGEFHPELLGDGGTAAIGGAGEGRLDGSFSFPEARLSGDFDAEFCPPEDDSILRYLEIVDGAGQIREIPSLVAFTECGAASPTE